MKDQSRDPPHSPGRDISFQEVAKHNRADDCWMVIDGKVYDVTEFVPRHPGGNMIYSNAGKDSTHLFDSYHPASAREVLKKFYIGNLDKSDSTIPAFRADYGEHDKDREFYDTIKKRVDEMFKEAKINPRFSIEMYLKSTIILAGLVLSVYGTYYVTFPHVLVSMICAACLGFFSAQVGVSIQHDGNHGAFSNNATINKWAGWMLDVVGASSYMWKQQHVIGHHVYTNVDGLDPDIRVKDPDVRRTTNSQPWRAYQVYQHLYLGFLYGALSVKSILVDDFSALSNGSIGAVPLTVMTTEEKVVFWSGKLLWASYYVIAPLVYSPHSVWRLLMLWTIAQLATGWVLAFLFQVNHVTECATFFKCDADQNISRGWAMSQVEGSTDFAHGSWFWLHFSGGLNYQVVHHLFPWVCHTHYAKIAPIVEKVCKEYGVKYVIYPSFKAAVASHMQHLKNMGTGTKKIE